MRLRALPMRWICLLALLLTGVALTPATSAWAEHYEFERYSDQIAGRQSSVYQIVGDSKGFLWFASDTDGLLRFDGYELIKWPDDAEQGMERISHAGVLLSQNDDIWVATWGGGLFYQRSGYASYRRFQVDENDTHALADNRVQQIYQAQSGQIWIGTLAGLNYINAESASTDAPALQRLPEYHPLHDERIWGFAETSHGIWVATSSGLFLLNPQDFSWRQYVLFPEALDRVRANETRTVMAHNERVWIGSNNGIFEVDIASGEFSPITFPANREGDTQQRSPRANVLFATRAGTFWAGGSDALIQFNPDTREFVAHGDAFLVLRDVDVRTIHEDNSGGLWVGSRGQGILRSSATEQQFRHVAADAPAELQELLTRTVSMTYVNDQGDLWLSVPKWGCSSYGSWRLGTLGTAGGIQRAAYREHFNRQHR